MNLASQAWETGNLLRARELLSRHQPQPDQADLRGFEWRLLWGLAHEDKTKFCFHAGSNSVASVAISPDGQWLAWCAEDGRIRVADVEARSEKFVLPGNSPQITSLAFSADGHWLASGGNDGLIGIWDILSWTLKGSLKGHIGIVQTLSFHPNGTKLVSTAADATVRIWDWPSLAPEQVFPSPEKSPHLSVSPDGRLLATFGGLDNSVRFWSLEPQIPRLPSLPPQQGIILSVTFAAHAETAIISAHDSRVTNWELNPLHPGVTYWQKVLVGHVALSADAKILATGGNDNLLKVWRAASGQELRVFRGHTAPISHLALSADGKTLVSADSSNEIKVWATDPAEEANVLTHDGIVVFAAISPDGEILATSDPNFLTVRLWNLRTRSATRSLQTTRPR
jgi:WD40 repeat protein